MTVAPELELEGESMEKIRVIVVATDFSEAAGRAARRGALLADAHGLPLEIFHVVRTPGRLGILTRPSTLKGTLARDIADARQSLEEAVSALASPGRSVAHRLIVGNPQQELIAQSNPDVLLVIGARREMTLADVLFGSTAQHLVRKARGPVLVARLDAKDQYRSVLAGVDLARGSATLLDDVAELAPDANLAALNAYRVPFEGVLHRAGAPTEEIERQRGLAMQAALAGIMELGRRSSLTSRLLLAAAERGDPARLLVEHASKIKVDLIAVARRGRSFIESLLVDSVSHRVVAAADRDVLVLQGAPLS